MLTPDLAFLSLRKVKKALNVEGYTRLEGDHPWDKESNPCLLESSKNEQEEEFPPYFSAGRSESQLSFLKTD